MKPLQLQIEGINSFKQKQTINFEELAADGVFGIFGPTGSGKSTILDALFLSLYGRMGRSGKNCRFINIELNSASVSLTFSTTADGEEKCLNVTRIFRIKNDALKQTVSLSALHNGEETLISENVQEVNEKIEQAVGFTYDDFKRCVSLSQGEFNSFLEEGRTKQVATVARIFSLEKYGKKLTHKIAEKRSLAEREIYALNARLDAFGDISRESISALTGKLAAKKDEYKKTKSDIAELGETISAGSQLITGKKRLEVVEAAVGEYESKTDEIALTREKLGKAKKAAAVMPQLREMLTREKDVLAFADGLKKLNGNLKEKTQYEVTELRRYEQVKESVYNEVLKHTTRKERLEALKPDVKRLDELKGRREEILAEYEMLDKEMRKKIVERDSLAELLKKSEQYIDKLSDEVANVSVSKEAVKAISLARDIEIEKRAYSARLAEIERDISTHGSRKNELVAAIKKLGFDTNELKSKLARADERIMAVYGSNESRYETLAMLANENVARHKSVELAKHINAEIRALKKQNEIYAEKVEDYAKKSIKAIEIKTLAGRDKESFEKSLDEKLSERESYLGSNFLSIVTGKMDIGDTCPICEGRIDKLTKDSRISLEPIDNEIKVIKHKISQSVQKHEEADGVRSELEARADELERLIEFNRNKINLLVAERDSVLDGYVEVRGDNESALDEVLRLSDEKVAKLEQLVNASNQLEKEVVQNEKLLERKDAEFKFLVSDEERLGAEHEKVSAVIGELTLQYLKYEEVLKGTSARSISDIIMDNDGRKAKTIVKLAEQKEVKQSCMLHIQELESDINEITLKINALSANGDALETERLELQKRIAALVPEGSTVEDEQAASQSRISELVAIEQKQRAKYDNVVRLIKLIDANLAEQNAMYRLMLRDLNEKKRAGVEKLKAGDFSTINELKAAYMTDSDISSLEKYLQNYDAEYQKLKKEQAELAKATDGFDLSDEELKNVGVSLDDAKRRFAALEREIVILENSVDEIKNKAVQSAEIRQKIAEQKAALKKLDKLYSLVSNDKLLGYVADDYIQTIADSASDILLKLSNGRYYLVYDEDFAIIDNIAGGFKRDVNNLSGGESFLVSLSVSMAMSMAVSKISNKPIDMFFLDEGFGTLDRDLLESVACGIERLGEEICIGIISHVPELQSKVKSKIMLKPASEKNGTRIISAVN